MTLLYKEIDTNKVVLLVQKANKQQMNVHLLHNIIRNSKLCHSTLFLRFSFISPIAPKLNYRQILVFYSSECITVY